MNQKYLNVHNKKAFQKKLRLILSKIFHQTRNLQMKVSKIFFKKKEINVLFIISCIAVKVKTNFKFQQIYKIAS